MIASDSKITLEFIKEQLPRDLSEALARLICCNFPVLLLIAATDGLGRLPEVLGLLLNCLFLVAAFAPSMIQSLPPMSHDDMATSIKKSVLFMEGLFFGSPQGYFNYGLECLLSQNDTEAAKWFAKAAEKGLADAQFNLGLSYFIGKGVTQDKKQAVRWWQEAAGQGLGEAQYNLGVAYGSGDGITKDQTQAVKWFKKAAGQGFVFAQHNLGVAYYDGYGVEQNDRQAAQWITKAAQQGFTQSQFYLGIIYFTGEGVSQDTEKAMEWWQQAAEQGHGDAQEALNKIKARS